MTKRRATGLIPRKGKILPRTTTGFVKILAPPFEPCPQCLQMNTDKVGRLFRVADERGPHLECDDCGYNGPATHFTVMTTPKDGTP